jgi:cobalt-zinc-cadmium resistance protein CzcA
VPDVTNRQVQISTFAPTLAGRHRKAGDVPGRNGAGRYPGLEMTRSISRNGFSQVTAVFTDRTDIYFARQQVTERLAQARTACPNAQPISRRSAPAWRDLLLFGRLPSPDGKGVKTVDGKPGWQSDGSYLTPEGERLTTELAKAAYLRTVQDWIIRPQMRAVRGVAGVDLQRRLCEAISVEPNLNALASYGCP